MLATPVVYPEPKEGIATLVNAYNPVTPVLSITRDLLIYGDASRFGELVIIFLVLLVLFTVFYIVLKSSIPFLIERN
jgi:lipopolysaccharide transport system permease protein